MKLYDALIEQISGLVENTEPKIYPYDEGNTWPENENFALVLNKDTAFEIGGGSSVSVNYSCMTTNADLVDGDNVVVYGPDIKELTGTENYVRISLICMKEEPETEVDTDKLYQRLQDIDFVKYHVFPKGYMMRTSGQTNKEQVRIDKKALTEGLSFEKIGNTFIRRYKENPKVQKVCIIFVTAPGLDFEEFERAAKRATEIKYSLSKLKKGMPTECSVCDIREICNEVQGLRELHFGKIRNKNQTSVTGL